MIKQREATVNVSSSVPISVFMRLSELEKETENTRSTVIRELIIMGLSFYDKQKSDETNNKGE